MLGKGKLCKIISITLLVIALIGAGMGIKNMSSIRPAEDYVDKGVFEFVPYKIVPTQRENTGATSRQRRLHPTKIVYVLHYKAKGHASYRYRLDTAGEYTAKQMLAEKKSVARKVMAIKSANRYITVEPDLTAESYTRNQQYRYVWIIGCSLLYIGFFAFYIRPKL